ncbi:MAG: nuclear transport factor 2 family protein [Ferruginibacter sp.]
MKRSSKPGLILIAFLSILYACSSPGKPSSIDTAKEKIQINTMLDSFNRAAAKADYKAYFDFYTDDAIFTGTDATERWEKAAFMAWAKPIFDKGHAWNFKALERHIYFDQTGSFAWFDELLNTQMKICRGSGVLVKQGTEWKFKQYILSTTIPNDQIDSVIKIKSQVEDSLIGVLQKKQ